MVSVAAVWYNSADMDATAFAKQTAIVVAEAILLYMLSRLIFVWVLQSVASRNPHARGGRLVQLLRLPGNLVHELSHAAGYLIFGYTVRRMVPCIFDPRGRGSCQPGRPWSPIALPWLATGLAAIAPLLVGTLALRGVATMLAIDLHFATLAHAGFADLLVNNIWANLQALDFNAWQTYLFLYLAFSIGSELAPSSTDVRRSIPTLLGVGIGLVAAFVVLQRLPADTPICQFFTTHMDSTLDWLQALLNFGILTVALAAAITVIPALLIRAVRR